MAASLMPVNQLFPRDKRLSLEQSLYYYAQIFAIFPPAAFPIWHLPSDAEGKTIEVDRGLGDHFDHCGRTLGSNFPVRQPA